MITDQHIFKASGQYDKEIIQHLHISGAGITSISNIGRCVSLIDLNLSNNSISEITGLESLHSLQRLDLSYNRISRIENVGQLTALEFLDLRGNQIESLADLNALSQLPQLKSLFLRNVDGEDGNPICQRADYPSCVLQFLPDLELLDGGHALILSAFTAMNQQMNSNNNGDDDDDDNGAAKHSQLDDNALLIAPEPWFSLQDTHGVFHVQDLQNLDTYISQNPRLSQVQKTMQDLQAVLSQDSGGLIRKATLSMSAATKK